MTAWCMGCKSMVDVKNPKAVTMKNGKPATQGTCAGCGKTVYKINKG